VGGKGGSDRYYRFIRIVKIKHHIVMMTIILIILCVLAWYKYKNKLGVKGFFDDYKGIPRYLSIVGALSVL
jgi:hypothetical protein